MKLLQDDCNCEEYTIEYYILKRINYLQFLRLCFPLHVPNIINTVSQYI